MIKMLLIAPYREFADSFTTVFNEHNLNNTRNAYDTEEYKLEVVISSLASDVTKLDLDFEVLISRGLVSEDLQSLQYFLPVVEVPIAAGDLVYSLMKAKNDFNPVRVAVMGSRNMVMGVEKYGELFNMHIEQYILTSADQIWSTVQKISTNGVDLLIGGSLTCTYAKKLSIPYILLESGRESIWYSISEAKRVAYTYRKFKEKTEVLNTILENAFEGIISIDANSHIEVFNEAASKMLSLERKNVIGKALNQILPTIKAYKDSDTEESFVPQIIKYNKKLINVGIRQMSLREETIGGIYTLLEVSKIQELESKFREEIYSRGHLAKYSFDDIIGESFCIQETIQTAKKYSCVDSNILITGKTGTGKELFAESIHNFSARQDGPFVAVNCAALSESLLKSELFGYADGAFTGATKGGKPGLFELAHQGTIFLDEISEIPLGLQGVLLRVIQEREIRRLGHDKNIPIDVRIISAANKDLFTLIEEGSFREDLYYRLDILTLHLPELSKRRSDISVIADYWIKDFCIVFNMEPKYLTEKAKSLLCEMDFPGNIRQLRNVCERLVVLSQDQIIDIKDVEFVLQPIKERTRQHTSKSRDSIPTFSSLKYEMRDQERLRVLEALNKTGNNKEKAASMLGLSRTTLWRRMKSFDLI